MAKEIERTFLVITSALPPLGGHVAIEQGYLSEDPCVRVRTLSRDGVTIARLTVKGQGLVERDEFEWEIPVEDAGQILSKGLWSCALAKNRYQLGRWEIDEFKQEQLEGLWLAEIELERKREQFELPDWLGPEVTHDPRFTNLALARDGVPDDYWKWLKTGEWNAMDHGG